MIRRPPRSTLFPTRRSSDLYLQLEKMREAIFWNAGQLFGLQFKPAAGVPVVHPDIRVWEVTEDRKSTRLNSSHLVISYAVFCLKKKNICVQTHPTVRIPCFV